MRVVETIQIERCADAAKVIHHGHAARLVATADDVGDEQCGDNGNDDHHHHDLDKGKAIVRWSLHGA